MRNKKELVFVHQALSHVRNHMEEELDMAVETPEYEALDVSPIGIHYTCEEQEEAVKTLSSEMVESVAAEEAAPSP